MKIDVFTHVMPERYKQCLYRHAEKFFTEKAVQGKRPALTDQMLRLDRLDPYDDMVQVLSVTMPPLEEVLTRKRYL